MVNIKNPKDWLITYYLFLNYRPIISTKCQYRNALPRKHANLGSLKCGRWPKNKMLVLCNCYTIIISLYMCVIQLLCLI